MVLCPNAGLWAESCFLLCHDQSIQSSGGGTERMRVAVDMLARVGEPYVQVQDEHVLGMMLRPGFIEVGLQRSAMRRVTFQAGEMGFFPRRMERWVGT